MDNNIFSGIKDLASLFYVPREVTTTILKTALGLIYDIRVSGLRNIPRTGGAVLVCNHTDFLDVSIQASYISRRIVFLGKNELFAPHEPFLQYAKSPKSIFKNPILGSVFPLLEQFLNTLSDVHKEQMKIWGGIPVIRSFQGESAKDAVAYYEALEEQMVGLLKDGELLSIFPEGTRSKDGRMSSFKAMAAKVAIRAGVPIIPSGISGAWNMSELEAFITGKAFKTIINYNIGNPLLSEQYPPGSDKKAAKIVTEELEKRVRFLTVSPERRSRSRRFSNLL